MITFLSFCTGAAVVALYLHIAWDIHHNDRGAVW